MFNWEDYIHDSKDYFNDLLPWEISIEKRLKGSTFIHPTAVVEEGVIMKGSVWIGPNCFVGAHAYLRDGVYLMSHNSIGPGCEIKSSFLFMGANLAHFNFVGNSIIGRDVNFEAGAIIANHYNERANKEIVVSISRKLVSTGVTKFGAVVGDGCKIGANAVLSPGTILPPGAVVPRLGLVDQNPHHP